MLFLFFEAVQRFTWQKLWKPSLCCANTGGDWWARI